MYDTFQEQEVNLAVNIFKGLDKKTPTFLMQPGQADICQNWRFDKNGHLTRRPSYAQYNATSLGGNPITYLERIYIGSNKYLLAAYGVSVVVGNDSLGTFSNLRKGLTEGLHYAGQTYKNFHYLCNGVDSNFKTDGTAENTDIMGCAPMEAGPSCIVSAAAGLDPTSTYKYKFSWVYDGYQEANASGTKSVSLSGTVSSTAIYNFETAPINATHLNIYRTEGEGDIYYYHSQLTKGQASSHPVLASALFDTTADADLETTQTAPTDNVTPPICEFIVLHKERIFLAGNATYPSRLYFSDISGIISYPDVFPTANYIDISPDDGDEITGLAIDPTGYLCVFKKNCIRKIFTDGDPTIWSVSEPFATTKGCWAPYTIKPTPYGIIYLAKDGWRIFDGQNTSFLGGDDRISSLIKNEIMLTRFDKCVGHYHNNLAFLSYTDRASNATHNNKVLIYDFLSNNFMIDYKNIECFCNFHGGSDWNELYWGDSVNGYVYQEEITLGEVVYSKLSDFRPQGSLSSLVVWNTETDPYLELGGHYTFDRMNGSVWSDYNASTSISAWDMFPSAYSVSGTYTSPAIQTNAKAFYYAYWHEILGGYGDITVAFRTSSTSAGLSGSWSNEYTNPVGSDISDLTANDWAQFRITMSAIGASDYALASTPRIYQLGGYAFKFTYRVTGEPIEKTIDADCRSGYTQLTPEGNYSRLKRFQIDHDGTGGNLSCIWDIDEENMSGIFDIDLENNPKTYYAPFPTDALGRRLRLRFQYNNINALTIRAVNILTSPQPERY